MTTEPKETLIGRICKHYNLSRVQLAASLQISRQALYLWDCAAELPPQAHTKLAQWQAEQPMRAIAEALRGLPPDYRNPLAYGLARLVKRLYTHVPALNPEALAKAIDAVGKQ